MSLIVPEKILSAHAVALGKTGAGKSSVLRYLGEHLLEKNERVCIIDPKGDWWGLKSSADGRGPGYPVIAFGDFKETKAQDIPLNEHSGKHVAELVATGNRPCVLGFRGWMPAQLTRFWIDFSSTLFNRNAGRLSLVIDEVHNFAPKGFRAESPEAARCLHWTNRLLAEGRGVGIVCLIASQRPQKVHNDTLTSCETLLALRVIHKSDRLAVKEWIDGCGDGTPGTEVLGTLAQLTRGEAWVWSPESNFGPQRVKFPLFKTFDSFAPPQVHARVAHGGWAEIDLGEIRQKFADVIKDHETSDPKFLRATIAKLQADLLKAQRDANRTPVARVETKIVERPVEKPIITGPQAEKILGQLAAVNRIMETVSTTFEDLAKKCRPSEHRAIVLPPGSSGVAIVAENRGSIARGSSVSAKRNAGATAPHVPEPNGYTPDRCQRAILEVLAAHEAQGCEIRKLAILSCYSIGGTFRNALGALRAQGLIDGSNTGTMRITPRGQGYGPFDPLPSGHALLEHWYEHPAFEKCDREIMNALAQKGPLTIQQLSEETGYAIGGTFRNALGRLRTAGVIAGRNTEAMTLAPEILAPNS